jgi:hypothetical protein
MARAAGASIAGEAATGEDATGEDAVSKQPDDGLLYLQAYPRLQKWINQCVGCQRNGYKPEMPEQIGPGVVAQNLRRFFPKMGLNDVGLCEQCGRQATRVE